MKFMNTKRFASTVMAGVLTLSLAVPAFAADAQVPNSTVITAKVEEIPISVVVPNTGLAQINPYGLPVTITKPNDQTVDLVGQQITTQPLSIKNQGKVSLDVNATLAVIPEGGVSIAASAGSDDKQIKVDLEVAALNDTTLAVSSESETLDNLLIDKFADKATWEGAATLAAPTATKGTTTVTPAASGATMAVLGGATVNGDSITYAKNSIALFRLTGAVAESPKNGAAEDPWKETDGFKATVVFKFTPHALVDAAVTLDKNNLSMTSGTQTLTATFAANETDLTVTGWAWASDDGAVCVANGSTATGSVQYIAAGTANVTCTATLSDGSTRTATCVVTCS